MLVMLERKLGMAGKLSRMRTWSRLTSNAIPKRTQGERAQVPGLWGQASYYRICDGIQCLRTREKSTKQ